MSEKGSNFDPLISPDCEAAGRAGGLEGNEEGIIVLKYLQTWRRAEEERHNLLSERFSFGAGDFDTDLELHIMLLLLLL